MADTATAPYVSVTTDDGFTVSTNSETEADLRANLQTPAPVVNHDDAEADPSQALKTPAKANDDDVNPKHAELEPAEKEAASTEKEADSTEKEADKQARDEKTGKFVKDGKPRDDPHARVKQATAKEAEAKRERDEARAEAARYRAELEAARAPKPDSKAEVKSVASETFADYPEWASKQGEGANNSYERYLDDRQDWRWEQKEKAAAAKAETEKRDKANADAHTSWTKRMEAFRDATPDFDQRFKADTPIDTRIHAYLKAQDDGPAIVLYLSDHQDLAQRIVTLHPIDQIGEIGKIQARLEAASTTSGPAPTPPASAANAPIKPLAASPHHAEPDDGSDDEPFDAYFEREMRKRKKGQR